MKQRVVLGGAAKLVAGALFVLAIGGASARVGRAPAALPFGTGERLAFVVTTSHTGKVGDAVMTLSGPVDVRGTRTILASFDTHIGVALMKGSDESRSWIDLSDMTSLRFAKHARGPFSADDDSVDIFPTRHSWIGAHGASGSVTSDNPLDELSFIYFLRTVRFAPDSTYSFDRHYDTRRSPTTVRVVKRETLHTPAGTFETVELEMRVKDGTNYKGDGVIHLWISDDQCRLPVRIESAMPVLGTGILTLDSAITPTCRADRRDDHQENQ